MIRRHFLQCLSSLAIPLFSLRTLFRQNSVPKPESSDAILSESSYIVFHTRRYLNSKIPIEEFQEWFIPLSWDIEKIADANVRELVCAIDLEIAEFTGGYLSEKDLRYNLFWIMVFWDFRHEMLTDREWGMVVRRNRSLGSIT